MKHFAFPHPEYMTQYGLTKRELFAAMALQGLLADSANNAIADRMNTTEEFAKMVAVCSVTYADALLDALEKG